MSPSNGDAFMNAASPGVVASFQPNEYYSTQDAYLEAIADAMRVEYETIVQAGLCSRSTAPTSPWSGTYLPQRHRRRVRPSRCTTGRGSEQRSRGHSRGAGADARLLGQLRGTARARHSAPDDDPRGAEGETAGLLFEAANPRHAHEWVVWREVALPDEKYLVPGVIDSTTNTSSIPRWSPTELSSSPRSSAPSASWPVRTAGSARSRAGRVHPSVCWPKLRALAEGAYLRPNVSVRPSCVRATSRPRSKPGTAESSRRPRVSHTASSDPPGARGFLRRSP